MHAVSSVANATLSSDFTSTTTGAWTTTGLTITPASGNAAHVTATLVASISVQGSFLIDIGGNDVTKGAGWLASASVSVGADLFTYTLSELLFGGTAPNGATAITVYFYTLQASTFTLKGASGIGPTGAKISAMVFG